MGSTVTAGKAAAAFVSQGKAYYVLYERTYEKNVYPHRPEWSAVQFGSLDAVYQRIASSAGAACDGALQSSSGAIVPANYWKAWMRVLDKPLPLSEDALHAPIMLDANWQRSIYNPDEIEGVPLEQALDQVGLASHALMSSSSPDRPMRATLHINLLEHAAQFEQLLHATRISAWRVFGVHPALRRDSATPDNSFGVAQLPPAASPCEPAMALSTGCERFVVASYDPWGTRVGLIRQSAAGAAPSWRILDCDSVLKAQAIREAAAHEAARPGSVLATIERVERELERSVVLDDLLEQRVHLLPIQRDSIESRWEREQFDKLVALFAADTPVTLAQVRAAVSLRAVGHCLSVDVDSALANQERAGEEHGERVGSLAPRGGG